MHPPSPKAMEDSGIMNYGRCRTKIVRRSATNAHFVLSTVRKRGNTKGESNLERFSDKWQSPPLCGNSWQKIWGVIPQKSGRTTRKFCHIEAITKPPYHTHSNYNCPAWWLVAGVWGVQSTPHKKTIRLIGCKLWSSIGFRDWLGLRCCRYNLWYYRRLSTYPLQLR